MHTWWTATLTKPVVLFGDNISLTTKTELVWSPIASTKSECGKGEITEFNIASGLLISHNGDGRGMIVKLASYGNCVTNTHGSILQLPVSFDSISRLLFYFDNMLKQTLAHNRSNAKPMQAWLVVIFSKPITWAPILHEFKCTLP